MELKMINNRRKRGIFNLDQLFVQTQAKIWLGELLQVRFDDETSMADLIADGELL
jgi:hypothetical protein